MAMDANIKRNEELVLDDSIKVNNKGEAILGVLEGPCADVINPTRNERQYDEELWNNVFKDPIVNEYFECGGILGELDHPADRTETDTSKVAICMPEKPKKGKDGKLWAKFDILDTPNGRIVYTLAKYGYKLGVSSRGNGDVYEAFDGREHVDPKTYELKAFDIVLLPAVKAARLALKESVGNKTFKQAIKESLESATKDEKRIMVESLKRLKIDYKIESAKTSNVNAPKFDNIANSNVKSKSSILENVAVDNRTQYVDELQRQIKVNKELNESLQTAQEKLSVCYAKEAKYEVELEEAKKSVSKIFEGKINALEAEIKSLTEQLAMKDSQLNDTRVRMVKITEGRRVEREELSKTLNESISKKDSEILRLEESLKSIEFELSNENKVLKESLEDVKKDLTLKQSEYNQKLIKSNQLVEHYKKIAQTSLNKYIESKAKHLGVSVLDVKERLNEKYSFDDIDRVCEDLKGYQVTLSKLPIQLSKGNVGDKKDVKMRFVESVEPIKPKGRFDDEVDDSLLRLAGLKN